MCHHHPTVHMWQKPIIPCLTRAMCGFHNWAHRPILAFGVWDWVGLFLFWVCMTQNLLSKSWFVLMRPHLIITLCKSYTNHNIYLVGLSNFWGDKFSYKPIFDKFRTIPLGLRQVSPTPIDNSLNFIGCHEGPHGTWWSAIFCSGLICMKVQ